MRVVLDSQVITAAFLDPDHVAGRLLNVVQEYHQLIISPADGCGMSAQLREPDVQALSFDERLGLLIDRAWIDRQNRRLTRRLQDAHLRLTAACIGILQRQNVAV